MEEQLRDLIGHWVEVTFWHTVKTPGATAPIHVPGERAPIGHVVLEPAEERREQITIVGIVQKVTERVVELQNGRTFVTLGLDSLVEVKRATE